MDKYAAEKLAQEYYALGSQAALEKLANSGLLDPRKAKMLAELVGQSIGKAGRVTGEAGALKRLSGLIHGTEMNEAQRILRAASGKANQGYAEHAHNFGYTGPTRPSTVIGFPGSIPRQRLERAVDQGMMPGGHYTNYPTRVKELLGFDPSRMSPSTDLKTLSEVLKSSPSEAELLASMNMDPFRRRYYNSTLN